MEKQVFDPIHLPCPDMAGCVNPDPKLTQNSIEWVSKLRQKFADQFQKKPKSHIPARFRVAQFRKQDEALEAQAVDGADSSLGGAA